MRHPKELRTRVRSLYQKGTPRREIAELTGVPVKTVHTWTRSVHTPLEFIKCEVCGIEKRVKKIPAKYCSVKCKSKADYRRRVQPPLMPRSCICCGRSFKSHRSVQAYCSARCKNREAQRRRRRNDVSRQTDQNA